MRRTALILASALTLLPALACKRRDEAPQPPQAAAPVAAPQAAAPAADLGALQRIAVTEQILAKDPKNLQAWVGLGNDYFDTRQHRKAIEAYGKALELAPDNPDVLTDQGIMYRELGLFDQAIANFEKANKANPKHLQSLFNLGVVYGYDKKDTEKAIQIWNRVIEAGPSSPQALQARQAVQELKARPAAR